MLRLTITFLLFFLAREYPQVSSMVTSKVSKSNAGTHESQNHLEATGGEGGAAHIEIASGKPEFKTSGQNYDVKRSGLTLEQRYGKIARWFGSKSGKKKQLNKKQKCCICCGRPTSNRNYKTIKCLGKGSEKFCTHAKTRGHDGRANLRSDEVEIIEGGTFWDLYLSWQRSANTKPETTSELALQSGSSAVAGIVQRDDIFRKVGGKSVRRSVRTVSKGDDQCICQLCCAECCPSCLYDCCGTCIIFTFGGLAYITTKGVEACCCFLLDCLGFFFKPCCG